MCTSLFWNESLLVGNGVLMFNGHRVSVGDDENILEMDGWMEVLNATELYTQNG